MSDQPESFADHPVSLAELKAEKTESGKDWTPRDVLIQMLRNIDKGTLKCDEIFIAFGDRTPTGVNSHFYAAGGLNAFETVGLVQFSLAKFMGRDV